MKKKIVIWMDQKKARVYKSGKKEITEILVTSPVEKKTRVAGEKSDKTRFGNRYFSNNEDRKNQKEEIGTVKYFKMISEQIGNAEHIGLIGPGTYKLRFFNYLQNKSSYKTRKYYIESVSKLTENQLKATVTKLMNG